MRGLSIVTCISGVFSAFLASNALAFITPVPTGSSVAGGFYSNLASSPLQDPAGYGFSSVSIGSYAPSTALLAPSTPSSTIFGFPPGANFQSTPVGQAFNDGLPLGQTANSVSVVSHTSPVTAINLEDIHVDIPRFAVRQQLGATGYVGTQLNFISSYVVNGTTGVSGTTLPINVKGKFGPAGYAQFQAVFNYTFTPFGSTSNLGIPVPLGSITYDFSAATPNLPFNVFVHGTNSLIPLNTSSQTGLLDIHGYAWIAGDPFELEISTVPEPSTWVMGLAGLACGGWQMWRRRRAR